MDSDHILYKAATEALVSETSGNSTFEKLGMAAFALELPEFKKELFACEKQIKEEFELKSMPGPWRSGKSVVLSCMKLRIKMTDDNGMLLGKTALQTRIKQHKLEEKEEPTADDYTSRIYQILRTCPVHLYAEVKQNVYKYVKD